MKTLWTVLLLELMSGSLAITAAESTPGQVEPPLVNTTLDRAATPDPAAAAPAQPAKPVFILKPVGIVKDVEKLAESGTDPAVIKTFVQSWPTAYSITASDILRLHDLGVPSEILTTLIQHGADLGTQSAALANASSSEPAGSALPSVPDYSSSELEPPNYVEPRVASNSPQYVPYYTEPGYSYSYAYGYWPLFSYGFYRHYPDYRYRVYQRSYVSHQFYPAHHPYPSHSFGGHSFGGGQPHQGFSGHQASPGRQGFSGRPAYRQ